MALFAICGPHASGKSTFVQTLKAAGLSEVLRPDDCVPERPRDVFGRTRDFMVHRIDALHRILAGFRADPDRDAFFERSMYDVLAYSAAFVELGWITSGQHAEIAALAEPHAATFKAAFVHVFLILEPGLNRRLMEGRWKSSGPKWREEAPGYLEATNRAFEALVPAADIVVRDLDPTVRMDALRPFLASRPRTAD